jgi:hypothetical protein
MRTWCIVWTMLCHSDGIWSLSCKLPLKYYTCCNLIAEVGFIYLNNTFSEHHNRLLLSVIIDALFEARYKRDSLQRFL